MLIQTRVNPKEYQDFDLNPDVEFAREVGKMLSGAGFSVEMEVDFEQIHDTL